MRLTRQQVLLLVLASLSTWGVHAQPVTEVVDRFELNYSTMRIRFYGEANADFSQKGFEGLEKTATDDGLLYALTSLAKVRVQKGLQADNPGDIANELTKQAFVANTIYFTDGRVRVELESSLAKALDRGLNEFNGEEPKASASDSTSILIQVEGIKVPILNSEIRSSEGELLYSPLNVAKSAYKKQMVGRWFFKNSTELKSYIGVKPVLIEAKAEPGKSLVVSKESWEKLKAEHPRLIEEAKLAFVLPLPPKSANKSGM
jgi:hypothetical protein